ncbi:MAG: hypothetical protein GY817_01135 [bacterium]|nr:hypothetical protein [bacterium]
MFIWTPVIAGFGTLREVQTEWNLYDVLDAHEALEIKNEIETQISKGRSKK